MPFPSSSAHTSPKCCCAGPWLWDLEPRNQKLKFGGKAAGMHTKRLSWYTYSSSIKLSKQSFESSIQRSSLVWSIFHDNQDPYYIEIANWYRIVLSNWSLSNNPGQSPASASLHTAIVRRDAADSITGHGKKAKAAAKGKAKGQSVHTRAEETEGWISLKISVQSLVSEPNDLQSRKPS